MAIIIRTYRHPHDLKAIHKLFVQANKCGAGSPYVEAMDQLIPYELKARGILLLGLTLLCFPHVDTTGLSRHFHAPIFYSLGALFVLFSLAITFFVWRRRRHLDFILAQYMAIALEGDLKNIIAQCELTVPENGAECISLGPSGCWIAEKDGKIVGFVGMKRRDRNPMVCDVSRLAVSPDHRRKGIGDKLMAALVAHARAHDVKRLELITSKFNKAAIQMYDKHGWEQCGEEDSYGQKMLIWGKDLSDFRLLS